MPSVALADVINDPFDEPRDMQPCVMEILHALAEALSSWLVIKDTHAQDFSSNRQQ